MGNKSITSEPLTLPNVRLSFARLYKPKSFQQGQDPRFEATFLLDPSKPEHAATLKLIQQTAAKIAKEAFGGTIPQDLKFTALGDGNNKSYDGYKGMKFIASHNKTRPLVVNKSRNPVNEGDPEAPYSGCYVDGRITLWVQNNQYGKRINVNLRGVRFRSEGHAFGAQQGDPETEFEPLAGDTADSEESSMFGD